MRKMLVAATLLLSVVMMRAADTRVPTIDQLIELKRPGGVAMSPDATRVAYTVTETNWEDNDKKYGEFEVVDTDYRMSHLHMIDVDPCRFPTRTSFTRDSRTRACR